MIAVNLRPMRIYQNQPIRITIERDADVRVFLTHSLAKLLRMQRAAVLVNVQSIRLNRDFDHLGLQILQDGRGDG